MTKRKSAKKKSCRYFVRQAKGCWLLDGTSEQGYGNAEVATAAMKRADKINRSNGTFVPAEVVYGYTYDVSV